MTMLFPRALRMVFINMRIIRAGRFMSRIAVAGGLLAGAAAVIAFPAGSAAAQGAALRAPEYPRTLVVSSLNDAGPGSLRAAILTANATAAGGSTLIRFSVNGTITLISPLPTIARNVTINAKSAPPHVSAGPPVVALDFNRHP